MKNKLLLFLVCLNGWVHAHSDEQIFNKLMQESYNFILGNDDENIVLKPSYGLRKSGYRAYSFPDIVASGFYKLAGNITRRLFIAANDVTVDLCGHTASGGIDIATGLSNVTILNGQIDVANAQNTAIQINSTCQNIILKNLVVKNAIGAAINCDTVFDSFIQNCDLTQNATGLALDSCNNIYVENCTAIGNTVTGFGLLSSNTCSFIGCSALSTGQDHTKPADTVVAGFVSNDGYANIFERCIANSTQALSTTDFNSIIAGFALRGSESCTKIIECEASNATTSVEGVNIPYGIFLESTLVSPLTLTTQATDTIPGSFFGVYHGCSWSPDGKYFGALIPNEDLIVIYEFDRRTVTITRVATAPDIPPGTWGFPSSMDWSPDGNFIVATDNSADIIIYEFNRITNELSVVLEDTSLATTVEQAVWSPDNQFIAVARSGTGDDIIIFSFNRVTKTISQFASVAADSPKSVAWRPDGRFLAIGDSTGLGETQVYEFNRGAATLTRVAESTLGPGNFPQEVAWSPDGKYIAAAQEDSDIIIVYEFDPNSNVLRAVDTASIGIPVTIQWSADGRYILTASFSGVVLFFETVVFEFDRGTGTLTLAAVSDLRGETAYVSRWSPDGRYIVTISDGNSPEVISGIAVYEALNFTVRNIVKNNTIYCNSGNPCPGGIGITGSSIENMIIGNTAYSNPVPQTDIEGGGPVVFTNYAFVTNIYNPLFSPAPSELQNISLGGCEPIAQEADLDLLWIRAADKVCDIQTKVVALSGLAP